MFPPLEQQGIADEFKPGSKFQGSVVEHRLQAIGSDVSSIADFIHVGLKVHVGFDEENVID